MIDNAAIIHCDGEWLRELHHRGAIYILELQRKQVTEQNIPGWHTPRIGHCHECVDRQIADGQGYGESQGIKIAHWDNRVRLYDRCCCGHSYRQASGG